MNPDMQEMIRIWGKNVYLYTNPEKLRVST